jgi:hypothetical protein
LPSITPSIKVENISVNSIWCQFRHKLFQKGR